MEQKKEPALVIMAAGIGSRYGGGIKQLEAVGPNGEIIIDYSRRNQSGLQKNCLCYPARNPKGL